MYVIYCKIMYQKFYLSFGALHIAVLVFKRTKKGIFLVSAEKYFGNFSFFRERRVAVTTMPKFAVLFVYMLKELIN